MWAPIPPSLPSAGMSGSLMFISGLLLERLEFLLTLLTHILLALLLSHRFWVTLCTASRRQDSLALQTECALGSDVPYAVVELWQQHHIFQRSLDRKVCICLKQKVEMTPSLDRNMEEMTFPTKHYLTSPHKMFNCFTLSFVQVILGYSDRSWAF